MDSFKEKCVALRKRDHTLSEIVRITGRPKTSVYYCIRSIPLSGDKWKTIRAAHGARIRTYALNRKGKSTRAFKKFHEWDANTIFLVSHFLFDGSLHAGGCSYNNRNIALLNSVEASMRTIYNFKPTRYHNRLTGVSRISYFNVALQAFVDKMSQKLLGEINSLPHELKRIFLQAFFDDEGCIDFRPGRNKRSIRGYQKDVKILKIVEVLLRDFEISARFKFPNEVEIVGKENLLKFEKEIGFSPGVRINGRRSNSIWKQSLEKREILRRAIESYKPIGSNGVRRGR